MRQRTGLPALYWESFPHFSCPRSVTLLAEATGGKIIVAIHAAQVAKLSFTVPPVVDLVFDYAELHRCTLIEAILAIRSTENAKKFRHWIGDASESLLLGRRNLADWQQIVSEVQAAADKWKKDVKAGVKYETRQVNLSHIPLFGKILSTSGLSKITLKDPILAIQKPYLLFLNDLYRELD